MTLLEISLSIHRLTTTDHYEALILRADCHMRAHCIMAFLSRLTVQIEVAIVPGVGSILMRGRCGLSPSFYYAVAVFEPRGTFRYNSADRRLSQLHRLTARVRRERRATDVFRAACLRLNRPIAACRQHYCGRCWL